ncbi:hypothetical protein AAVH_01922 [Aphelenchoides avenae]|nr:hypothetical protein AAVH_01922 [Aphelenchus avenae]
MKDACDKELQNATDHLSSALGEKFNSVLIEAESACNSGDSTLDLMPRFLEVVDEYNSVIAAINAIEVPLGHKQASPHSSAPLLNGDVAELKRAFHKLEASSVEREQQLQAENRRLAEQVAELQRQFAELVKQRSVSARSTIDSRRRRDSERSDIEVIPHDACRSGHDDTLSIERISINDA